MASGNGTGKDGMDQRYAPTATVKKQQKISPSLGISSVVIDIMKQSLHHLILINPLRIKSIDKLSMLRHLSLSKIEIHLS